ncbi:MAG: tyrosine--tRNA ligase [Vicinamibacterales bacterium]
MNVLDELRWRGLLHDSTDGLESALAAGPVTAYIGFDPTAPSLHAGSLLTILGLARLQRHGHRPIALVGGGTGLIGDPSGKSQERNLLTLEQTAANADGIRRQLERFLDFSPALSNAALMRNNVDWLRPIGFLDFLRDVGKHFTVNYMMAKESVKRRLDSSDGISFTEFSYQLLQAYDFLILHDRDRCTLQMGGTDQWGNITAGCDLVRKVRGTRVHGLVWPLLTTSSGAKFGKTESGAVWLDADRTSPYEFYQFWLKSDDREVVPHLRRFTFLDEPAITAIAAAHAAAPERREAQRALAREVTRLVHGESELQRAERASKVLFGGSLADASPDDILTVFGDVPSIDLPRAELDGDGLAAAEAAVRSGLTGSKGEAHRLVKQGGLYVNDRRLTEGADRITAADLIGGRVAVLRKGQRERRVLRVGG